MSDIDDAISAIDRIRQPADVVSQEEGVIRRGWVTSCSLEELTFTGQPAYFILLHM